MNVLVIMNDALRPDHMGCYGYPRNTTPNCDRLAAEGVRFEQCIAVSSHTFPPVVSICTGRDTASHGLMTPDDYARWMKEGMGRTPLHALAERGMSVDGELVMRWAPLGFKRDCNDFDEYVETHRDRSWFYYAEPYPTHLPYNPPRAYYEPFVDEDFQPDEAARERLEIVRTRMILHPPDVRAAMEAGVQDAIGDGDEAHKRSSAIVEFQPDDEPGVRALYDGEVRVFDDMVYTVYYSGDKDTLPPSFWRVEDITLGSNQFITVEVTDWSGVKRVGVSYTWGDGRWHTANLSPTKILTENTWTGTVPYSDTLSYFVQAVDTAGNVGMDTNKAWYYRPPEYHVFLPIVLKNH